MIELELYRAWTCSVYTLGLLGGDRGDLIHSRLTRSSGADTRGWGVKGARRARDIWEKSRKNKRNTRRRKYADPGQPLVPTSCPCSWSGACARVCAGVCPAPCCRSSASCASPCPGPGPGSGPGGVSARGSGCGSGCGSGGGARHDPAPAFAPPRRGGRSPRFPSSPA